MKNALTLFLAILFFASISFAQTKTANLYIENPTVNGNKFSWEIHITETNDWGSGNRKALGDCSWYFDYNEAALSNPVITYVAPQVAILDGYTNTTGLVANKIQVTTNLDVNNFDGVALTTNVKYHIYTVEMDIVDPNQSAELAWDQINTGIFNALDASVDESYSGNSDVPLPVELSSFNVNAVEGTKAQLNWETATEVNNYGFEIERSIKTETVKGQPETESKWEKVGFVKGNGNSNSTKVYSFTDKNLVGGSKFLYRLKQIDIDGKFEYSEEVEIEVLPTKYELMQNYPNPFNPNTNIKFSLPEDAKVSINVYNVLGEKVASVLNGELKAGFHEVNFGANSFGYQLSSGVYLYTIESKNFTQVKKMILMK